jgi:hypothetical protein
MPGPVLKPNGSWQERESLFERTRPLLNRGLFDPCVNAFDEKLTNKIRLPGRRESMFVGDLTHFRGGGGGNSAPPPNRESLFRSCLPGLSWLLWKGRCDQLGEPSSGDYDHAAVPESLGRRASQSARGPHTNGSGPPRDHVLGIEGRAKPT